MPADRKTARPSSRSSARRSSGPEGTVGPDPETTSSSEAEGSEADGSQADGSQAEGSEAEGAAPLNRAERRGKAKHGSRPQQASHGKVAGRSSSAQAPRLWSNRRGGG